MEGGKRSLSLHGSYHTRLYKATLTSPSSRVESFGEDFGHLGHERRVDVTLHLVTQAIDLLHLLTTQHPYKSAFSLILDSVVDLGMTMLPTCKCHLRITCAVVFPFAFAICTITALLSGDRSFSSSQGGDGLKRGAIYGHGLRSISGHVDRFDPPAQ